MTEINVDNEFRQIRGFFFKPINISRCCDNNQLYPVINQIILNIPAIKNRICYGCHRHIFKKNQKSI